MYSAEGLKMWEVITYSGIFAIGMLALATLIGTVISHFVMRVPAVARQAAPARERAEAEPRPVPAVAGQPNLAAG